MWYNILPSLAIVGGVLGFPVLAIAGCHKLFFGNVYQRDLQHDWQRGLYVRDERISGNAYKPVGLENIPDEEEAQ